MNPPRNTRDICAAAHALTLVGDRWALLVVRELLLGPKRFTDLRTGLAGISSNVLTQRLEDLETGGVLRRRKLPPPYAAWVYELTDWGKDLEPVIVALGRWGVRSPSHSLDGTLNSDSLILSFRTMFSPAVAGDFEASVQINAGEDRYRARVARGKLIVVRGSSEAPEAVIAGTTEAIASVVYGGRKFLDATRSGDLSVEGDKALAKKFLSLFPLPAPAEAGGVGAPISPDSTPRPRR
jgi:DNA-binding HxlR family transcriptional regulator